MLIWEISVQVASRKNNEYENHYYAEIDSSHNHYCG